MRDRALRGLRWLVVLLLSIGATHAIAMQATDPEETAAPRVGLVTMAPGVDYWARFGHNAILIDDGTRRTLYNYGYFDFQQPGFITRFLQGRMLYQLVALPMDVDLRNYAADGRGAVVQWLDLPPAKARELAAFLAWNALPENADYRYDYFIDNCSTRVRDALDGALDGALKRDLSGRSHGFTFRDEARRLAATLPWLYLGIDLGLGPFTDRSMSLWEESYVPGRLHDAVRDFRGVDGTPLVREEIELLPHRLDAVPPAPPRWRWRFAALGIALAILFELALGARAPRAARIAATAMVALLWTLSGLIGLGLLALWAATDHAAAWGNENALLFNPLCLLLLGALPALVRGREASTVLRILGTAVVLCAGIALFLKFLPFRIQSNGDWIALMLPIHAALAWRLARRTPSRPA
jgi:hypothetical protein